MNLGREPGTRMPSDWAASGGRLVLPIDLSVTSDSSDVDDDVVGRASRRLEQLGPPASFVSLDGVQYVDIRDGAWKIELPPGKKGRAAKLTFFLDFSGTAVAKNDVSVPSERVYFTANCWREDELDRGARALTPFVAEYEGAQEALNQALSHETGDRRLDGVDPLGTLAASVDMAGLVASRDDKLRALREAGKLYPRDAEKLLEGHWPGASEWLAVVPIHMAVRRKSMLGEDFLIVGTWEVEPIYDDKDEFEEV